MKLFTINTILLSSLLINTIAEAAPVITGYPKIISPNILNWSHDLKGGAPNLTDQNSNSVMDLHAKINKCDMVLTTAGNYHMALRDLWYDHYLPSMKLAGYPLRNWYYTTSPPIAVEQIEKKRVTFGNVRGKCRPQVAVGPRGIMDQLEAAQVISSEPVPIIKNRGNVLLVRKGNPKNIQSIWDLGRHDVRVATSNPFNEPGSFGNYSNSIYDIAFNDPMYGSRYADKLFNKIFNSTTKGKWVSGRRIHHRDVPWLVARNHADVAPIFYHLALFAKATFPNKFDIVPLGGTVEWPAPLPGNRIATMFAVKITGNWNDKQLAAQEGMIDAFKSYDFTVLLEKYGLDRPEPVITE